MNEPLRRPADWPSAGPIDLSVHDLPHASSATEWWYVNAHVDTGDCGPISIFAAFFRLAYRRDPDTGAIEYAHSLTWAITDSKQRRYMAEAWVDRRAPKIGLERLDRDQGTADARINRAMREVLERGSIPLPDQMFARDCFVHDRRLELDFCGYRFEKRDDGTYRLRLFSPHYKAGCDLVFTPEKAPVRHGDDGVVRGATGEDMFYYFIPRCAVSGEVTLDAMPRPVSGSGWYDHEFGGHRQPTPAPDGAEAGVPAPAAETVATHLDADHPRLAWNWAAIQLDDGSEVSAYVLAEPESAKIHGARMVRVAPDGRRTEATDVHFDGRRVWRSGRTFFDYPVDWHLSSAQLGVDLSLTAAVDDQELMTVLSHPSFWEGRVEVEGNVAGDPVTGRGYIERSGFAPLEDLDDFFGAVGEEVRKSVEEHLPRHPTWEQTRDMIASKERDHYMDGVSPEELARAMADPVRLITDRGGKSWRSYAALACCDVVGGDSRKWRRWLAMPEFMHVGSLIVDDVQDRSLVRRGGPSAHVVYGEPQAINSGTACYFMGQRLLFGDDVSDTVKLRLYDLYFEALRAGHAGQAIDLDPKTALIASVVASGDATELVGRIIATHRLKTAAPAAALARMGALAGGGTEAEIEAVGGFFEALGLAFQIIDDVLNLRGFKGGLKARAEDVRNGTITFPVAVAFGRLGAEDRQWLHETLASKPDDDEVVARVVALLESAGAIDHAASEARDMVERAWSVADRVLRDSFPKIMLRAFSWYVLERHY